MRNVSVGNLGIGKFREPTARVRSTTHLVDILQQLGSLESKLFR